MSAIEVNRLKKYYGRARGVEDVSFEVAEGEIFGFIGPNGAGKSTTIRVMLNFIFPTSGSVRVLGLDAVADSRRIRSQVGYLPAEVGYYEDMTVTQVLEYSAGFYGIDAPTARRRIAELSETFELEVGRRARDLSTGNRRKVGIVAALLHRPRLLILDEPTGGLDPLMQARMFEVLAAENQRGATVFFSSHVLSEVQRFCHRVGILKEGRVIKVEEVGALRAGQFQKVEVTFAVPHGGPLSLPGVIRQRLDGCKLELLYNGDVNALIRLLGRYELTAISMQEPPLEEVFMHYYASGRESA